MDDKEKCNQNRKLFRDIVVDIKREIVPVNEKIDKIKEVEEQEQLPEEVVEVLEKKEKFRERLKDKSKRNVQRLIYGRTLIIILLLLIQFFLLFSMVFWLKEYSTVIYAAFELVALITVVVVMNRHENPMFKLAWIILILAMPVFGAALYLFVQNQFGFKVITWRVKILSMECKPYLKQKRETKEILKKRNPHVAGTANYISYSSGHPVYDHTVATYFPLGEDKFKQLLVELSNAKKFIFMEYFIIKDGIMWDSVLEILKKKVKEGVEVRVMYDGLCTFTDVPANYPKVLRKYGIQTKVYGAIKPVLSTVQNNRDHRKIAVIDGRVAFTGGVNLADEYINEHKRFGHWKDTAVMLQGEAVRSFTLMFLTMWNIDEKRQEKYEKYLLPAKAFQNIPSDGFVMPYGDCPFDDFYVAKHIYLDILNTANRYVHIMTPYLILDNETIEALCYAARRGVDVKIILPHIPDKKYAFWLAKSYQEELLAGGVKIYEYTPGFVHAKVMVADDNMAVIGSSNLDFRSFYLHYECGVYLYENSEILKVEEDVERTLKKCQEVLEGDWKQEKWYVQLLGKLLRLVAPLM
ncbi:MAG: cardiolipin synthase [Lachnospiraceae bacterium]|nr:cardiolipin synthase [Lachnospiraceae bacterium]